MVPSAGKPPNASKSSSTTPTPLHLPSLQKSPVLYLGKKPAVYCGSRRPTRPNYNRILTKAKSLVPIAADQYANGSTWQCTGLNLRFKDWRLIHRARLGVVPVNREVKIPRFRSTGTGSVILFTSFLSISVCSLVIILDILLQ